jgi:very-long-chain (3R)-3-hydroxyacyl-CoA dehydratase
MAASTPLRLYLILYNSLCTLGWAYVLILAIPTFALTLSSSLSSGSSLLSSLRTAAEGIYSSTPATAGLGDENDLSLARCLIVVQCAAILEIVHAAVGAVRSPLFVTTMQVGSRIVALHMIVNSEVAQSEFEFFVCCVLCSCYEVDDCYVLLMTVGCC